MRGTRSRSTEVMVQVGWLLALHNTSAPTQPRTCDCPDGITDRNPSCTAASPITKTSNSFHFAFWKCSTPEVTSMTPNVGNSGIIITIKGKGFGPHPCYNDITIGGKTCNVQNSNMTSIPCTLGNSISLEGGTAMFNMSCSTRLRT